jgi:lysophospholipase L1-like esterase
MGSNVLKVDGIAFGDGAVPIAGKRQPNWVLIIGDSITEGIQADNGRDNVLYDYSWLDAQALLARGYETGISACGYSGWVRPGCADGDVPGYYVVNKSADGKWVYDDATSRWNKIDGVSSLLDSQGKMSGYGSPNQPPSVIFFNYGTNETLSRAGTARMAASIEQCLPALRKAAPNAEIVVAVPFGIENTQVYGSEGLLYAAALRRAVRNYLKQHPDDRRTHLVDLGANVANALASPIYGAGVHPNMAGHAFLAPLVLQVIERFLPTK